VAAFLAAQRDKGQAVLDGLLTTAPEPAPSPPETAPPKPPLGLSWPMQQLLDLLQIRPPLARALLGGMGESAFILWGVPGLLALVGHVTGSDLSAWGPLAQLLGFPLLHVGSPLTRWQASSSWRT